LCLASRGASGEDSAVKKRQRYAVGGFEDAKEGRFFPGAVAAAESDRPRWCHECESCGKLIGSNTSARRMRENVHKHAARCIALRLADTSGTSSCSGNNSADAADEASSGGKPPAAFATRRASASNKAAGGESAKAAPRRNDEKQQQCTLSTAQQQDGGKLSNMKQLWRLTCEGCGHEVSSRRSESKLRGNYRQHRRHHCTNSLVPPTKQSPAAAGVWQSSGIPGGAQKPTSPLASRASKAVTRAGRTAKRGAAMKAADPLPALSESGGIGCTQSEENSSYCSSDNYGPAAVVLDALGRAAKHARVNPPLENGQHDIRPSRSQVRDSLNGICTTLMFQLCEEQKNLQATMCTEEYA